MSEPIGSVGWPGGARAAVSLTYDGGLPDHLILAEPLLRVLGLRATFYVNATLFLENPRAWAAVGLQGHEIGNHSLYGVTGPRGELPNWTLETVDSDLEMTEAILNDYVPGVPERSFAYPGDQPICAEGSYVSVVERRFRWARTRLEGLNHAIFCNPASLRCQSCAGMSGAGLVQRVEEAVELGAWSILVFEGLGMGIDACGERDHELLLRYLARRDDLYIEPVRDVGAFITEARERMTVR